MTRDASNGWNDVADKFIELRSDTGVELVSGWAEKLPNGGKILDLGCGHGAPLSVMLDEQGFEVYGVEASPKLAAEFEKRLPGASVSCEAVEESAFFDQTFDGALAIGLIFLLTPETQSGLIPRVADALKPDGRFLFSAPKQICTWKDLLTGRSSWSLGAAAYEDISRAAGLTLTDTHMDAGENHYFDFIKADPDQCKTTSER